MRLLWPKQEQEQFRDHNAENPFSNKRNKGGWRVDKRRNSGMTACRKKYFSRFLFALSCNSFKLSLRTLENNLKSE